MLQPMRNPVRILFAQSQFFYDDPVINKISLKNYFSTQFFSVGTETAREYLGFDNTFEIRALDNSH